MRDTEKFYGLACRPLTVVQFVCSACVAGLGALALIGYLLEVPAARVWAGFSQMPPLVAAELLLVGIGVVAARNEKSSRRRARLPGWTTAMMKTIRSLTVSRRRIEMTDGATGAESQPDKNSSFRFAANFEKVAAIAEEVERMPKIDDIAPNDRQPILLASDRLRVLLVEDNLTNQAMIKRQIEQLGMRVEIASDGALALEKLAVADYDVILMDCQLPVMDGYEATRRIRRRESETGRHTPIVALTANAMADDVGKCLAAGMDDYLSKPVRREHLAKAFERALKKRTACADRSTESVAASAPPSPSSAVYASDDDAEIGSRLNLLAEECGLEAVREIVSIFQDEMLKRIIAIQQFVRRPAQAESLEREAHALRGACLHLGATKLADLGKTIERAAAREDFETARQSAEKLAFEFERVYEKLELALRSESPPREGFAADGAASADEFLD